MIYTEGIEMFTSLTVELLGKKVVQGLSIKELPVVPEQLTLPNRGVWDLAGPEAFASQVTATLNPKP